MTTIAIGTPATQDLAQVATTLASWQHDDGPLQLHPGDLGWHCFKGAAATAAALRTWHRGETLVAVGLLDGPQLLRLAIDPALREDDELARRLAADVSDPARGVLEPGKASIEARGAVRLTQLLGERGWQPAEPWIPFYRQLRGPVGEVGVRVATVDRDRAEHWLAVHWSAFRGTPFTPVARRRMVDGWRLLMAGPLAAQGRILAAFDAHHETVAAAAVWSAGPGRPGLLEPLGVHRDHRGKGYGVAMATAAASALREMGSSSAIVCTESSNLGAVATYAAAGFVAHPEVADLTADLPAVPS